MSSLWWCHPHLNVFFILHDKHIVIHKACENSITWNKTSDAGSAFHCVQCSFKTSVILPSGSWNRSYETVKASPCLCYLVSMVGGHVSWWVSVTIKSATAKHQPQAKQLTKASDFYGKKCCIARLVWIRVIMSIASLKRLAFAHLSCCPLCY